MEPHNELHLLNEHPPCEPYCAVGGGVLIGIAVILLSAFNGRILGVSGIWQGVIKPVKGDWLWKMLFIAGMVSAGLLARAVLPPWLQTKVLPSPDLFVGEQITWKVVVALVFAGVLMGFGGRLGSGCTSGHGVCGIARLSKRSFANVAIMMVVGFAGSWIGVRVLGVEW